MALRFTSIKAVFKLKVILSEMREIINLDTTIRILALLPPINMLSLTILTNIEMNVIMLTTKEFGYPVLKQLTVNKSTSINTREARFSTILVMMVTFTIKTVFVSTLVQIVMFRSKEIGTTSVTMERS